MKNLVLTAFIAICGLMLVSCNNDDFKEEITIELKGSWNINAKEGCMGNIIFTNDNTFVLTTTDGKYAYGDYNEDALSDNTIVITYAEDEEGNEILTDEDYENGGIYCQYNFLSNESCQFTNLPYFIGKTVILMKNN